MQQLLERAQAGDGKAREALIRGNLRLVLSVLQKFTGGGENMDDLFQVGCIGLKRIHDYSFMPPDRRFNDSGFFLPDFNERDEGIQNVLFMVDTSGSVDDRMLSLVYGEISAAVEQFNGRLFGMLGFFNTDVMPPIPFCTIRELLRIRPKGYGGTDFGCVFRYIEDHPELTPSCIVVFTDGEGLYPPVEAAMGIPVLWILHGDADFPRWGCTARLI